MGLSGAAQDAGRLFEGRVAQAGEDQPGLFLREGGEEEIWKTCLLREVRGIIHYTTNERRRELESEFPHELGGDRAAEFAGEAGQGWE